MIPHNLQHLVQEPLTVPVDTLFEKLTGSLLHVTQLLDTLDCSPDQLAATLHSPELDQRVQLQVAVSLMQTRLAASAAMPQLIMQLLAMTQDEKTSPETRRRCIVSLLNIGGLSTASPKPAPTPEPPPKPRAYDPDKLSTDEQQALDNLLALEKDHGIDLARLSKADLPRFADCIHKFLQPQGYQAVLSKLKQNAQAQALQNALTYHPPCAPIDQVDSPLTKEPAKVTPNPAKQAQSADENPFDHTPDTLLPQDRDTPSEPDDPPTYQEDVYVQLP